MRILEAYCLGGAILAVSRRSPKRRQNPFLLGIAGACADDSQRVIAIASNRRGP
jgi:hypothetical protein